MMQAKIQQVRARLWQTWQTTGTAGVFAVAWTYSWMQLAGSGVLGRIATWIATWFAPPYYERRRLARYHPKGYIAPSATIHHPGLHLGNHVFIGNRVVIFQDRNGGPVELAERVDLHDDIYIQTGEGGSLRIGPHTHVQPRCQFSAYKSVIEIGRGVEIAPNCAFYPYDHGVAAGKPISKQPLQTKGGIQVEDNAWLGFGVVVLDGVRIGKGAVIGAGAVVTRDIPDGAIAVGVPAQVVNMRSNITEGQLTTASVTKPEAIG